MLIVVVEAVHSRVWAGILIVVVLEPGVEVGKLVEGFWVWMLMVVVVDGVCAWMFVGLVIFAESGGLQLELSEVVVEVHSGV